MIDQAVAETIGSVASNLSAFQSSTTTGFLRKLDQINRDFVNAAHTRHHAGGWSWMKNQQTNIQTKNATTLNGALTTASTSVILTSATDFDTSGLLWIKTSKGAIDFVIYTAKATNTLTCASGSVHMAHATAEKVEKCYALPSNVAKIQSLTVNSTPWTLVRTDLLPVFRTYYDLNGYLVFPQGIGTQDVTLWFDKSPTSLNTGVAATDVTTSTNIPVDFQWYAIYRLMAYIHRTRRRPEDAKECEAIADEKLMEALSYDANQATIGSQSSGLSSDW